MTGRGGSTTVRIAAIVLAAGMSRRMGRPKALLDLGGRPLLCHLLNTIREAGRIDPIAVVTGHQSEAIVAAAAESGVRLAHNPDYDAGGMLSSVKTGAGAVVGLCEAFFVMLLDQPLIRAQTLSSMIDAWQQHGDAVVVPRHGGRRGHPILLAADCLGEIANLPAQANLRDLVAQHRPHTQVVEVNDPGVLGQLDTPDDYEHLLNQWRTATCPTVLSEPA